MSTVPLGRAITGHDFDLLDWEEALRAPFDPWVERAQQMCVLRWSGFDGLEASEVHTRGEALIEQINGALAATRGTRPVRGQDVIQFAPDGTHFHRMLSAAHFEGRARFGSVTLMLNSDGAAAPVPKPKRSEVQAWTSIADTDDRLADALVYLGRREWFDLFKAIECIEDWAGGEDALLRLGWIKRKEFKRIKQTANSFRHRRGATHSLPHHPATPEEAFQTVALLIRKAFEIPGAP